MNDAPTYIACLTPAGSAAIATIGVCGPEAWNLVEPIFHRRGGNKPALKETSDYWLGRLGDDVTDDVVLSVDANRQRIEIHCHGGSAVVRWLLDLLRHRGAVEIGWEEWLRQTTPTKSQADAAIALAHAPTLRTAGILLDQYHGALEREMAAIRLAVAAGDVASATSRLAALVGRIPLGRRLTQPWHVVVAGAPNAGKSSLINALLGYQRAITSPIPGTTRDVVTAVTAFDGWPVELVDTAGLREEAAGLEALGIERAQQALANADLCLWVIDRTQAPPVLPPESVTCPVVIVCNKLDLVEQWKEWRHTGPTLSVSALTGQGVAELAEAIGRQLVPEPPLAGAAVPFTEAICQEVERVSAQVSNHGLQSLSDEVTTKMNDHGQSSVTGKGDEP